MLSEVVKVAIKKIDALRKGKKGKNEMVSNSGKNVIWGGDDKNTRPTKVR